LLVVKRVLPLGTPAATTRDEDGVSGCFADLATEAVARAKFPLQQIAYHH
jgi:hypothetical protein